MRSAQPSDAYVIRSDEYSQPCINSEDQRDPCQNVNTEREFTMLSDILCPALIG